jgi:hypothetical protein
LCSYLDLGRASFRTIPERDTSPAWKADQDEEPPSERSDSCDEDDDEVEEEEEEKPKKKRRGKPHRHDISALRQVDSASGILKRKVSKSDFFPLLQPHVILTIF